VFERFFADGRLVDPGVPEDLQKDVVNFRASAFLPAEEKKGGTPLVMLERLTKRLKVEVGAADLLLLEPGSVVTGSLKLAKLRLERGGKSMDLAQAEIAAISGGAGPRSGASGVFPRWNRAHGSDHDGGRQVQE
jgi:hypothetical protein